MSSMPDQEYWLPPLRPVLRQAWLGLRRHDTHRRPTVADDLSSDPQSSAAHAYRRSDSLELVRRRRASQPDQGAQGRRAATRAMWRCCPPSTAAGGPRMPSARARSQRAAYGAVRVAMNLQRCRSMASAAASCALRRRSAGDPRAGRLQRRATVRTRTRCSPGARYISYAASRRSSVCADGPPDSRRLRSTSFTWPRTGPPATYRITRSAVARCLHAST